MNSWKGIIKIPEKGGKKEGTGQRGEETCVPMRS